jgi:hypothetical protein
MMIGQHAHLRRIHAPRNAQRRLRRQRSASEDHRGKQKRHRHPPYPANSLIHQA